MSNMSKAKLLDRAVKLNNYKWPKGNDTHLIYNEIADMYQYARVEGEVYFSMGINNGITGIKANTGGWHVIASKEQYLKRAKEAEKEMEFQFEEVDLRPGEFYDKIASGEEYFLKHEKIEVGLDRTLRTKETMKNQSEIFELLAKGQITVRVKRSWIDQLDNTIENAVWAINPLTLVIDRVKDFRGGKFYTIRNEEWIQAQALTMGLRKRLDNTVDLINEFYESIDQPSPDQQIATEEIIEDNSDNHQNETDDSSNKDQDLNVTI